MINRNRILEGFYQVKNKGEFTWFGIDNGWEEDKDKKNRKIALNPKDILVPSSNGEYFNRISERGAVNIEIPMSCLIFIDQKITFDNDLYKTGLQSTSSSV